MRSARSPGAPAATCRTAPSAPRTTSAGSIPGSSRRSRATASRRSGSCAGAARQLDFGSLDGAAGVARRAAAGALPAAHRRRARPRQPEGAGAPRGGARAGDHAARRAAAVVGLPDPGLPQDPDRGASASCSTRCSATSPTRDRLPTDWVADQVARLERTDGDIDALIARLAHIRTWTYVAYHADWLRSSGHWQERARAVEDALSDALHERLTQRFIDRRTQALLKGLQNGAPLAAIEDDGAILVDGHPVGRIEGLRYVLEPGREDAEQRALGAAARRVLVPELRRRAKAADRGARRGLRAGCAGGRHPGGRQAARRRRSARLLPGADARWRRGSSSLLADSLSGQAREAVRQRLARWLDAPSRGAHPAAAPPAGAPASTAPGAASPSCWSRGWAMSARAEARGAARGRSSAADRARLGRLGRALRRPPRLSAGDAQAARDRAARPALGGPSARCRASPRRRRRRRLRRRRRPAGRLRRGDRLRALWARSCLRVDVVERLAAPPARAGARGAVRAAAGADGADRARRRPSWARWSRRWATTRRRRALRARQRPRRARGAPRAAAQAERQRFAVRGAARHPRQRMKPARPSAGDDGLRLDKWLWQARFFKTRPLAAQLRREGAGSASTGCWSPSRTTGCGRATC